MARSFCPFRVGVKSMSPSIITEVGFKNFETLNFSNYRVQKQHRATKKQLFEITWTVKISKHMFVPCHLSLRIDLKL